MKNGFMIIGLVTLISACATTYNIAPLSQQRMEEIIEINGVNQDDLYIRANVWFVEQFRHAGSVIQFQDKEAGIIKGKFVFYHTKGFSTLTMHSTITVNVREDRARIVFDSPSYTNQHGQGGPITDDVMTQFHIRWRNLFRSFNQTMMSPTSSW